MHWHKSFKLKYIIGMGITIGLATISRPTEVLIIFVPLLYNVFNFQTLKQKAVLLYNYRNQILAFTCIVFVIVSYQLVYWKIITGHFVFDSYSDHLNEGFNFLHPYILEFLFSFRKGWFIYTPIMIFAVIGFYFLYKTSKQMFFSFFIYFIINFYVMSSWSCWWYGTSFSSRAIIPAYVALAIPFGYFLNKVFSKKIKFVLIPVFILLLALNIFQSWQTAHGILEGSRMTRAYYKSVFLQNTGATDSQKKLLLRDKYSSSAALDPRTINFSEYKHVYRKEENFDASSKDQPNIVDSICFSKKQSFLTDRDHAFAGDLRVQYKDITKKSYLILKMTANIFIRHNCKETEARLAITMMHKGKGYEFKCIDIRSLDLKVNEWNHIELYCWTPDFWDRRDLIQSYFWNLSDKPIFVDDLIFDAYEPIVDENVF